VCDHRRLPQEDRFVISRVAVPSDLAAARKNKRVSSGELTGRIVAVDGYNVLITIESLLAGSPVYLCDDGFLRDTRGIFRRYRSSIVTNEALSEILSILKESGVGRAEFLLDQQISRSGELAAQIRERMAELEVLGSAKTVRDVDRRLKMATSPVATGDGPIIDASAEAVDIPGEVANRKGIKPIIL
jgi:hypothetical protein